MRIIRNVEQPQPRPDVSLPRSVAVFRALQLGDLLCSVPALRALRAALPTARIVLIGLPWTKNFVERFDAYVDEFVEFPGYPGLPEQVPDLPRIPAFFSRLQQERFDLAIQMHGSGSCVNPVTVMFGARDTAGFYRQGEFCPDEDRFLPYPEHEPEIWRHLRLMEFLGVPLRGDHLEFPLSEKDTAELRSIPEAAGLEAGAYVCIHPGARMRSRRWPPERFALVADSLARMGLQVVITGGQDETGLARTVGSLMRERHRDLAGKTTLGALGALVKHARLLVANDTGISHIAAALDVPRVVIVTGSDPHRWQPPVRDRHTAVYYPVDCRPCVFRQCPIGHPCALNVSAVSVLRHAEALLNKEYHYAT